MSAEPDGPTGRTGPAPTVEVRRSTRRRRTVSAYREGQTLVVLIPASLTRAQEREWVERMVSRLQRSEAKRHVGDEALLARAMDLSHRYLQGRAEPASVRWVVNQRSRWGSCTPADRTIRISTAVRTMPGWVLDYVILHELAHLLHAGHGPAFWALLEGYPRLERARGFLQGVSSANQMRLADPDDPEADA